MYAGQVSVGCEAVAIDITIDSTVASDIVAVCKAEIESLPVTASLYLEPTGTPSSGNKTAITIRLYIDLNALSPGQQGASDTVAAASILSCNRRSIRLQREGELQRVSTHRVRVATRRVVIDIIDHTNSRHCTTFLRGGIHKSLKIAHMEIRQAQ